VADTATAEKSAYVGPNALVYGEAQVGGKAQVYGEAQVYGKALVSGEARVGGKAQVFDEARVYGVMRSDGFAFVALSCADGVVRVIAGCRYFTCEEARAHWKHRAGTPLGDETSLILDYLEKSVALKGYGG